MLAPTAPFGRRRRAALAVAASLPALLAGLPIRAVAQTSTGQPVAAVPPPAVSVQASPVQTAPAAAPPAAPSPINPTGKTIDLVVPLRAATPLGQVAVRLTADNHVLVSATDLANADRTAIGPLGFLAAPAGVEDILPGLYADATSFADYVTSQPRAADYSKRTRLAATPIVASFLDFAGVDVADLEGSADGMPTFGEAGAALDARLEAFVSPSTLPEPALIIISIGVSITENLIARFISNNLRA